MQVPVLSAPVLQAPVVYQAVLSPYPTLLNPWRNTLCATNCVPHTTRSYPGLSYSTPEAGDRRDAARAMPCSPAEGAIALQRLGAPWRGQVLALCLVLEASGLPSRHRMRPMPSVPRF